MLEWPLQPQKSISISVLGAWYLGIYGSGNGWVAHTEIYGCISMQFGFGERQVT
jgi:hypothetical protein